MATSVFSSCSLTARKYSAPSIMCVLWLWSLTACAQSSNTALPLNYTTQAITVAQGFSPCRSSSQHFPVVEATIKDVHSAFMNKTLTCTQLVETYVQRIQIYEDLLGLNAVRVLVPSWQNDSAARDNDLPKIQEGSMAMPKLFCIPMLFKDNMDIVGTATTNGATGLADNFPVKDGHQVSLLRDAGAIILAKTNMAEWAFAPDISSGSQFGVIRNPYDTDRSTAGSSGGTAAGLAANFAMVGMGTDTGNSIRGPAGWNSLVGIRASLGLTSRSGVIPLDLTSDIVGPLGRSVEDTVRVLEVTVGVDTQDNLTTLQSTFNIPKNYTQFLQANALRGMKVGVMRQTINAATADPQVMMLFQDALFDLNDAGAEIVDNFTIDGNSLGSMPWNGQSMWFTGIGSKGRFEQLDCGARFKVDINAYLGSSNSTYKNVQDIVNAGLIHPSANDSMVQRLQIPYLPQQYPPAQLQAQGYICNCDEFYNNPCRVEFRQRLIQSMDAQNISVLVYPTWSNLPALIGDYGAPDGNNSPQISPPTGSPAMSVPMGFASPAKNTPPLPASLQFLARPFDEGTLIKAAYAYEQYTHHRRSPPAFPECEGMSGPSPSPSDPLVQSIGITPSVTTQISSG